MANDDEYQEPDACPRRKLVLSVQINYAALGLWIFNVISAIFQHRPFWLLLIELGGVFFTWYRGKYLLFELQEHIFAEGYFAGVIDLKNTMDAAHAYQEGIKPDEQPN